MGESSCQVELVVILETRLKKATTSDLAKSTVFTWSRSLISILTHCQNLVNTGDVIGGGYLLHLLACRVVE